MTTTTGQTGTGDPERLRAWARGAYDSEAGVELLIRSGLADRSAVAACWASGSLDEKAFRATVRDGSWSGGERRLLRLAGALVGIDPQAGIVDVLSSLDRTHLNLALAALAHAGGSHQHPDVRYGPEGQIVGFGSGCLPPLHPWPEHDNPA